MGPGGGGRAVRWTTLFRRSVSPRDPYQSAAQRKRNTGTSWIYTGLTTVLHVVRSIWTFTVIFHPYPTVRFLNCLKLGDELVELYKV